VGVNEFRADINKALANENLRGALGRFGDAYVGDRERAYRNRDFNALREEVSGIKKYAAEHMEELAGRFTEEAARRGARVYRAATAAQARDYILKLALERGVKTVVKSKSMASEEIHLNKHLEDAGLDVTETDLGEWIIQLSGQKPSHMVMPAIHMTRGEVAGVFSRETEENIPADIPYMVNVAREKLREKFLASDMGISGANIAVAETGTLVMVTNEGNGRLTTTLPPLHVVIVGLEKLVARLSDIAPILEALPRSATAQQITSYVTMLTGPARAMDAQGKVVEKEMHIVVLDNGRTEMQRDPVFRNAMQCIRCASCLNVCPVFQLVGGHVFGSVYTGGIGSILTAFLDGMAESKDIQGLCLGCNRCKEVCPGKVDLPGLTTELRNRLVQKDGLPLSQRIILEKVLPNRKLFHGMLKAAAKAQKPFTGDDGTMRHLPFFLAGISGGKKLPAIAATSLRDLLKDTIKSSGGERRRPVVGVFPGCLVDFVYPKIGLDMVKVLDRMGYDVIFPQGQTCCGYPARQLGAPTVMAKVARQNIDAFWAGKPDFILTPCPTCTYALKKIYPELLLNDEQYASRAGELANITQDFSAFIFDRAEEFQSVAAPQKGKITYHDSCHLKRSLGIFREPRELIKMTGAELVEMDWADRCCGFGGSYAVKYPELSQQILEQKINNINKTGADVVAVECPGCLMQIWRGLSAGGGAGRPSVRHMAEILADSI